MIQTLKNNPVKRADPILASFEKFEEKVTHNFPSWLHAVRKAGISHFSELGFPTPQNEEWRFTNIAPITKLPLQPRLSAPTNALNPQQLKRFTFGEMKVSSLLVFVDGHFLPQLSICDSKKDDIRVQNLATALKENTDVLEKHLGRYARCNENAFVALNTAFFGDGALVLIPKGKIVEDPIHLLFVSTSTEPGSTTHPRNFILAEEESKATIIENYVSLADAPHFTNAVTEIVVAENAMLEHCKIQSESRSAFHIATIQAHQKRNSRFISHSISTGASIARNNIHSVLDAEGIECVFNGLFIANRDQLVDHHTVVDHAKPHCNSHEFYHGILDGNSKGVFNGKIFVRKDAQKTDAKQTNRNLLLSDTATMDTKPQLEIYADDVKCTHGATIGQLDEEAIFYLRSRGIGIENAQRMLVYAFASDIVHRISMEPVREQLDRFLSGRLERHFHDAEKGVS